MKRKLFLKQILASLGVMPLLSRFASAKNEPESEIEALENAYCKAANTLSDYGDKMGFKPGARVRAQSRFRDKAIFGTIPPYGERWSSIDSMSVPVLLDAGYYQPWSMSNLTIIAISPMPSA